jgi:SAM-dependent methyltransferase
MIRTNDVVRLRWLNLGSGHFPREDCINVDISPLVESDVVHDLDAFPYPFEPGQFERIFASHVLEHLSDPFAAMREWHRLLAGGGELHIKVPHFSRGFTHPEHKRGFDVSFPLFFNPRMTPWYVGTPFDLKRMRLRWNAQPYLKAYVLAPPLVLLARSAGVVIDAVANCSPTVFSRLFCFWVGGFEEIEYDFVRSTES